MIASNASVAQDPAAELGAVIDRFRLIEKLRLIHWQRLTLGGFGAFASLAYNLAHKSLAPWLALSTCMTVAVGYLLLGALVMWVRLARGEQRVRQAVVDAPRDRALLMAEVLGQVGNAWLAWAAVGHVLICVGTVLRLHIGFTPAALPLWLALTPSFGLLAYGLSHIPTRERLLASG